MDPQNTPLDHRSWIENLTLLPDAAGPIGIFDSGYGGLTVFRSIERELPQYDYLYLGDNARAPYGSRSFATIYQYTQQCVKYLFQQGCRLVILACNTSSAKALRTIQQQDIAVLEKHRHYRVLGVIRPTTEIIGHYSTTNTVGLVATEGTVKSKSYEIELKRYFPNINLVTQACPMWVPLIEHQEHQSSGADYFVRKYLEELLTKAPDMDTLLLACTHYPLLLPKIKQVLPDSVRVLSQGDIVAESLARYLQKHPKMERLCSKNRERRFLTTDQAELFVDNASLFLDRQIRGEKVDIQLFT